MKRSTVDSRRNHRRRGFSAWLAIVALLLEALLPAGFSVAAPADTPVIGFAVSLLIAAAVPWAPAAAQTNPVEVKNAWARATPAKAENGAAYLSLQSAAADRLTGLSTPVAKKAELHSMTMDGTIMKMRQIAGIDLPAGQAVTLQPGKLHIMLIGLTEPLHQGQSFPLTLHFEKAGTQVVTVAVEQAGAMGPQNASGGGHMPMPMPAQH